jgi:hypothetical protein
MKKIDSMPQHARHLLGIDAEAVVGDGRGGYFGFRKINPFYRSSKKKNSC